MVPPQTYEPLGELDSADGSVADPPADLVPLLSQLFFENDGSTARAIAASVDGEFQFQEGESRTVSLPHFLVEVEPIGNLPKGLLSNHFTTDELSTASAATPVVDFGRPSGQSHDASWFDGTNFVTFIGYGITEESFRASVRSFSIGEEG